MLKHQQPESIEDYTEQLRKRLNGVLPPEKIEEIAQETQMHLADKAEELRNNPDVYERQAVAGFTPVSRYSRSLMRAWSVAYAKHRGTKFLQNISLIGLSSMMLMFIANIIIGSKRPAFLTPDLYQYGDKISLFALVATFVLAIFACRHQLKRMIYFCLATSVIVFISYGFLCGSTHTNNSSVSIPIDSNSVFSRLDAGEQYKYAREQYDKNRNQILQINTDLQTIGKKYPSVRSDAFTATMSKHLFLKIQGGLDELLRLRDTAPSLQIKNELNVKIKNYRVAMNKQQDYLAIAKEIRILVREKNLLVQEQRSWTDRMNAQLALMARPRGTFDWGVARSAAGNMLYITGFYLVADLIGGWLGMLCLQTARRWRNSRREGKTPPVVRG
jgi:hypothetical protein